MDSQELVEKIWLFQENNHRVPSVVICSKQFVDYLAHMFPAPRIEDMDKPNTTIKFMGIRVVRSEDLKENEILVY